MNDAPMKQPESLTPELGRDDLSEPKFDDIAVAIAQPVEPISRPQRDWFTLLDRPGMLIAMLLAAAVLGFTAVALTLQLRREPHEPAAPTVSQVRESTEKNEIVSPAPAEPPMGAADQKRSKPRLTSRRSARSGGETDRTKPVARRFGVIYGSSDRP